MSGALAAANVALGSLDYYERHARRYFEATLGVDMSALYQRFLAHVPAGGRILDAGSGSGRDTLAFRRLGYQVEAFDASPALCALSEEVTGIRPRLLDFREFSDGPRFDGIWACASLLHLPKSQLPEAVQRLINALRHGGVLYMSFKYGLEERVAEDGRFFSDMDERALKDLAAVLRGCSLEQNWVTHGEGRFSGAVDWINAILRKG